MRRAQSQTGAEVEVQAATLLTGFLDEWQRYCQTQGSTWRLASDDLASGQRIMEQPRALRATLMRQACALCGDREIASRIMWQSRADHLSALTDEQQREVSHHLQRASGGSALIAAVCRHALPFTADDILTMLATFANHDIHYALYLPALPLFKAMRASLADAAVMARCRPALQAFRVATDELRPSRAQRELSRQLDKLLALGAAGDAHVASRSARISGASSSPSSR